MFGEDTTARMRINDIVKKLNRVVLDVDGNFKLLNERIKRLETRGKNANNT